MKRTMIMNGRAEALWTTPEWLTGIPIQAVWGGGIFQIGKNKFSRAYKLMDINFVVAGREDNTTSFWKTGNLFAFVEW